MGERRVIFIVVALLFTIALVGVVGIMLRGESDLSGVPLSPQQRAEIDQADCTELRALFTRYGQGSGSVEADATALPRIRLRMRSLGCPIPGSEP